MTTTATHYTRENTTIETWRERDRQNVCLENNAGLTLLDVWDEDVTQLMEDGFLEPRNLHQSACDYVNYLAS